MEKEYVCANCCKKVNYISEDSVLCEACKSSLPTAKVNSRSKE